MTDRKSRDVYGYSDRIDSGTRREKILLLLRVFKSTKSKTLVRQNQSTAQMLGVFSMSHCDVNERRDDTFVNALPFRSQRADDRHPSIEHIRVE